MNMHRLSEEAAFQGEKQIAHSFSWCPHTSLFLCVITTMTHCIKMQTEIKVNIYTLRLSGFLFNSLL